MSQENENFPLTWSWKPLSRTVCYPGFDTDILSMQLVTEARLEGGKAVIHLRPLSAPPEVSEELENRIAAAVRQATNAEEVEIHAPAPAPAQGKTGPPAHRGRQVGGARGLGQGRRGQVHRGGAPGPGPGQPGAQGGPAGPGPLRPLHSHHAGP